MSNSKARELRDGTIRPYEVLLLRQLARWCEAEKMDDVKRLRWRRRCSGALRNLVPDHPKFDEFAEFIEFSVTFSESGPHFLPVSIFDGLTFPLPVTTKQGFPERCFS